MKNTILSGKQAEFLEHMIAKFGKVVIAKQLQGEMGDVLGYQQTKNRITQLTENGWLIRIKRGTYAISELSNRGFLSLSPYVIAGLLVEQSYVSFEAALSYHGWFDQFTDQFISIGLKQYKTVTVGTIQYRFIKSKSSLYTGFEEVQLDGLIAKVATAEKALVDMIHFRESSYALDLVIEKLNDYQDSLDKAGLIKALSVASQATIKIFGLAFDFLGWETSDIFNLVSGKTSTHRVNADDKTFNARWRLYYDKHFDKYKKRKGLI